MRHLHDIDLQEKTPKYSQSKLFTSISMGYPLADDRILGYTNIDEFFLMLNITILVFAIWLIFL